MMLKSDLLKAPADENSQSRSSGTTFAGVAIGAAGGIGVSGMIRTAPRVAEGITHPVSHAEGGTMQQTAVSESLHHTAADEAESHLLQQVVEPEEPIELPDLSDLLGSLQHAAGSISHLGHDFHLPDAIMHTDGHSADQSHDPHHEHAAADATPAAAASDSADHPIVADPADGIAEHDSDGSAHSVVEADHTIETLSRTYVLLIQSAVPAHFQPQLMEPTAKWLVDVEHAMDEVQPVYQHSWPSMHGSVDQAFSAYTSGFVTSVASWHGDLHNASEAIHTSVPTHVEEIVANWASVANSTKDVIERTVEEVKERIQQRIQELEHHTEERVKRLGDKVRDEVIHAVGNELCKVVEQQLVETGVAATINEAITVCAPELKVCLDAVGAAAKLLKATRSLF